MKNFERPEIIDTFENAEGVYLASGYKPYDPNDPGEIDFYFDINSHDGGSHSDCSFKITSPKGSHYIVVEAHLNNSTFTVESVTLNSVPGPASGTTVKKTSYGFLFKTRITHNNSRESCQFSISVVFSGNGTYGAYMGRQGNPTFPEAEALEVFSFYTNV